MLFSLYFVSDPESESESEPESELIRSPESESESEQRHHDVALLISAIKNIPIACERRRKIVKHLEISVRQINISES